MVTKKCKSCGATGVKFYTHGKSSKAKGSKLVHNKECTKVSKQQRRRKRNV